MSKRLSDIRDFRMKEEILSIADAIIFILLCYKNPYGKKKWKAYLVYRRDGTLSVRRISPNRQKKEAR